MADHFEGHWPLFSRPFIRQSFHYIAELDIVYFNNAKCACSTVKSALLKYLMKAQGLAVDRPLTVSEVHGANPLWSDDLFLISRHKTRSFSVVRNPFTRALSAYLDKIAKPGILRNQFCMQHNISIDAELSFKCFLRLINKSRHGKILDQHYRAQYDNIVYDIDIGRIIYLENFSEGRDDLNDYLGLNLEYNPRQGHGTRSASKLASLIEDECVELIHEIYQKDFKFLGYSVELKDALLAPAAYSQYSAKAGGGYQVLSYWGQETSGDALNSFKRPRKKTRAYEDYLKLTSMLMTKNHMKPSQPIEILPTLLDWFVAGTPIEQYIAADAITTLFRRRLSVEAVDVMSTKMMDIAPYFLPPRVRMIRSAIRQSKSDKAKALIDDLSRVTFDQALVAELRRKLDAG